MQTKWEIGLYKDGRRIRILGYSARKTKRALILTAKANAGIIEAVCDDADLDGEVKANKERVSFGSVTIEWTGFTEYNRE